MLLVMMPLCGSVILAEDSDDLSTETCLECHDTEMVDGHEVAIDRQLESSVHESNECIDCHTDVQEIPHEGDLTALHCGECHPDEVEIYTRHGRVVVSEETDAPGCADCHGHHDILHSDDESSRVSKEKLPATCGTCHEDIDLTDRHKTLYGEAVPAFQASVHGSAITEGRLKAASCMNCHSNEGSGHTILGPGDRESSINHFNIPGTCGKCHPEAEEQFWSGTHGQLVARGETESPVCTHCHGEHGIMAASDPRSPVSPVRVAEATCAPCHAAAFLAERFGTANGNGNKKNWFDTYHGLKSQAGDLSVANCVSCHEAHGVLPQDNPASSIHPDNLQKTCGECHPEITAVLATTPIHQEPGISQTPVAGLVKNIYIVLIVLVIGGMILYCALDWLKQFMLMKQKPQIRRMTTGDIWQHTILMVSFIVLVITGFSLRHEGSWWVNMLFGWEGGFPIRGIIHRVAAVVLILVSTWHLVYFFTRSGLKFLKDMLPTVDDLKQVLHMIGYLLGWRDSRPAFKRFSYMEKAEYWALVWGTIVMAITGLFLWFDNFAIGWFSKAFLDVMLVVHYYEAWLATLAILIWHMYGTVFSPAVYPMNPAWINGKMPRELYIHEHAADPLEGDDTTRD